MNKQGNKNGSRTYWNVVCECSPSKKFIVAGVRLTSNNPANITRSCGCLRNERTAEACTKPAFTTAYNHLRLMAKRRGIAVTLSFKEYLRLTKLPECHYCSLPIQWAPYRKAGKPFGHNVDRKDAAKPYTKANCVPCCPGCNESKMSRTYEEWLAIGKAIKVYRENRQ